MARALTPTSRESALKLAGTGAAVTATALAGSRFMRDGRTWRWYRRLEKPPFTPPASIFPVAWTALYALIAWSGWRVARKPASRARRRALGLWGLQLALNAAWSPAFFGARKPALGMLDIALMLPAIGAYAASARKLDRGAAWLMAPYLAWVGFAAVLNAEILRRNA